MMNKTLSIGGMVALAAIAIAGWAIPNAAADIAVPSAVNAPSVPVHRQTQVDQTVRMVRVSEDDDRYRNEHRYRDERDRRSDGKSAAIIGGSAITGALLGGLAGSGKGVAIGALSGGAAGYLYDRLTRHKTSGYGWH